MAEKEYISREAAIEEAKKSHLYFDIKPILQRVPAADVREVKRGEWIRIQDELCECSECARYWIPFGDAYDFHYCPNCGADMREESNG